MHQFYERTLKWVLDREALMLIVTLVVIVATVGLYYYVPKGFFPQQDTGQLMGTTEAAQDISFAAMKEKQEQVVQTVMQDPAVQAVGSFFGGGTGSALNNGRMFISLKPTGWGKDHRREDAGTVIARLRQKLENSRCPTFPHCQPGHPSRRKIVKSAISIRAVRSKHRRAEFVGAKTREQVA